MNEEHPINSQNSYASSKWMCENILRDTVRNRNFKAISLRYFNPIGANVSMGLKEFYNDKSRNIIPQILRGIKNQQKVLNIYGNQFPTKDRSRVRDYIHVEDLVAAHIVTMEFLDENSGSLNYDHFNIGLGKGMSVFELINEFEKIINKDIPVNILEKRPNEVAEIYADASKFNALANWKAKKPFRQMINDVLLANELLP